MAPTWTGPGLLIIEVTLTISQIVESVDDEITGITENNFIDCLASFKSFGNSYFVPFNRFFFGIG